MPFDPTLPKDAVTAQHILDDLVMKDQNGQICRYPTCSKPRKPSENGGKPPAYCDNPLHTPQRNLRARDYLKDLAKGLSPVSLETEQAATSVMVQSLRGQVLSDLERFSSHLGLYVAALRELSDPDIVAAQIEAAQYRADAQIAVAQETAETERSLRLSAEQSRDTALQDAQTARDQLTIAHTKMQEAETRAKQQQEAYELHITTLQEEHDQALETIHVETQQKLKAIQLQSDQAIAQARDATIRAEEEARRANMRAHDAETESRSRIESANLLVSEAQATLRREQEEVQRLRLERDEAAAEARTRAKADRTEILQLRTTLTEARSDARTRAEDDRKEIQRLRESVDATTRRAEELAQALKSLSMQREKEENGGHDRNSM